MNYVLTILSVASVSLTLQAAPEIFSCSNINFGMCSTRPEFVFLVGHEGKTKIDILEYSPDAKELSFFKICETGRLYAYEDPTSQTPWYNYLVYLKYSYAGNPNSWLTARDTLYVPERLLQPNPPQEIELEGRDGAPDMKCEKMKFRSVAEMDDYITVSKTLGCGEQPKPDLQKKGCF